MAITKYLIGPKRSRCLEKSQNVNSLKSVVFSSSVATRDIAVNLKPFGIHIDISGTNFPFPPDSLHAPRTARPCPFSTSHANYLVALSAGHSLTQTEVSQ
jgi:hypothetical protein